MYLNRKKKKKEQSFYIQNVVNWLQYKQRDTKKWRSINCDVRCPYKDVRCLYKEVRSW